jgi:hypothetical protein
MVSRTYTVRKIEPADRAKNERFVEWAEARGDMEQAQAYRESLAQWETQQGQEKEKLVCAVCGTPWLSPTARGTARPHRRHDVEEPSWDKVRLLRKDIQALQTELDRVIDALEPQPC